MQKVKFLKNCLFGAKGEERQVTERAAIQYMRLGIIEPFEEKEEKEVIETKEEKVVLETKAEKIAPKKAKITKSPR